LSVSIRKSVMAHSMHSFNPRKPTRSFLALSVITTLDVELTAIDDFYLNSLKRLLPNRRCYRQSSAGVVPQATRPRSGLQVKTFGQPSDSHRPVDSESEGVAGHLFPRDWPKSRLSADLLICTQQVLLVFGTGLASVGLHFRVTGASKPRALFMR